MRGVRSGSLAVVGLLVAVAACSAPAESATTTTTIAPATTTTTDATTTTTTVTTETPVVWPPRLAASSMVYDESGDALVLFGGAVGTEGPLTITSAETWVFDLDEGSWVRASPSIRPSSRTFAQLAYDTEEELIVMIGSGDPAPIQFETSLNLNLWAFDTRTESWRIAGQGPVSKERERAENITRGIRGPAIAYDSESERTVFLGGRVVVGDPDEPSVRREYALDETWAYESSTNTWTNMQPDPRPIARAGHAMVYDTESDRVLVWGGIPLDSVVSQAVFDRNVWAYDFDANTWTEHTNNDGPQPIGLDGPAAFDTESDRMVVIREAAEVWTYDYNTNTWTQEPPTSTQPIYTALSALTYIGGETDRVALYGGCVTFVTELQEYRDFTSQCSNELWFYDLNTNTWEKIGPPDQ